MGRIQEYDSSEAIRGLSPSETGVEATAQGARRIGALGQEQGTFLKQGVDQLASAAGKLAEQHFGRQETLKAATDAATTMNALDDSWNAYRNQADPNDPNTASRWLEEKAKPALEAVFTGPTISEAGARSRLDHRDRLLDHFTAKTTADMSIVAGKAAGENLTALGNQTSQAIVNNPDNFETANALVSQGFDDYVKNHPGLSAQNVAEISALKDKFHKSNAIAAVHGTVINDLEGSGPAKARSDISSGRYKDYLDANDEVQLDRYIKVQEEAAITKRDAREREADRQDRDAADADAAKVMASVQPFSAAGPDYFTNVSKFLDNHPKQVALWAELNRFGKQSVEDDITGKYTQSDPSVVQELRDRMYSEDPSKIPSLFEITKLANERKISRIDAAALHNENVELLGDKNAKALIKRVDDQAKSYQKFIMPEGLSSPNQKVLFQRALDEVHQIAMRKMHDGTLNEMLQEGPGADFVGNIMKQPKYLMSQQDIINDRLAVIRRQQTDKILYPGSGKSYNQQRQEYIFAHPNDDPNLENFKPAPGTELPADKQKATPAKSLDEFMREQHP